ncbi:hypothetical protein BPAE_0001g01330 [Botrytis paeoniae]|uniref:Uncharacterized protein n=1 Tax=Botrytis paeoniae TaxID=278948 RepID=A0A4Z1G371_9HELO|nr:hypothetical protein BPAE_0001g01330 [Botrytis paeoniae]
MLVSPIFGTKCTPILHLGAMKGMEPIVNLLVDLSRSTTNSESRNSKLRTSRADGVLAMVKIRGLSEFINRIQICILMWLRAHQTVSSVATKSALPQNLMTLYRILGQAIKFSIYWLSTNRFDVLVCHNIQQDS